MQKYLKKVFTDAYAKYTLDESNRHSHSKFYNAVRDRWTEVKSEAKKNNMDTK